MNRILLCCLLPFGLLLTSFHWKHKPISSGPIKTIIIDAGHGGKDPGAISNGVQEKKVTLAVALELKRILNENLPEVKVVMTRSTDKFIELHERGKIAQEKNGDFFISLHCNANPKTTTLKGAEIYVLGVNKGQERYDAHIRENEVIQFEEHRDEMYGGFDPASAEGELYHLLIKDAFRNESVNLAGKINAQIKDRTDRVARGVKQGPFIVLWSSGVPAILVEMGYLTNKEEAGYLNSQNGQVVVASSIYRAIKAYNQERTK